MTHPSPTSADELLKLCDSVLAEQRWLAAYMNFETDVTPRLADSINLDRVSKIASALKSRLEAEAQLATRLPTLQTDERVGKLARMVLDRYVQRTITSNGDYTYCKACQHHGDTAGYKHNDGCWIAEFIGIVAKPPRTQVALLSSGASTALDPGKMPEEIAKIRDLAASDRKHHSNLSGSYLEQYRDWVDTLVRAYAALLAENEKLECDLIVARTMRQVDRELAAEPRTAPTRLDELIKKHWSTLSLAHNINADGGRNPDVQRLAAALCDYANLLTSQDAGAQTGAATPAPTAALTEEELVTVADARQEAFRSESTLPHDTSKLLAIIDRLTAKSPPQGDGTHG